MKLKDGLIYRQIAGEHVVIPVGSNIADFNGIISLNETAAFLWRHLKDGAEPVHLVSALLEEYEVEQEQAEKDVGEFLTLLMEHKVLTDDGP